MGFLSLIPFLGILVGPILMAATYPSQARFGGRAERNARAAANWGLTYLLLMLLLLGTHVALLFVLASENPVNGFFPLGIPPIIAGALTVAHVVIVIVGVAVASGGGSVRIPFAIPYLRGPKHERP